MGVVAAALLVICRLCNGSHTHLFYCKKFIDSPVKGRGRLATSIKVCHRCLRMDSQMNLNNLNEWWEGHKNDCLTKHYCNMEACAKLAHRRQRHILCCGFHQERNKKRLANFKSSVDSDKLPSDSLLFVGNYAVAHPVVKRAPPSEQLANVIPNVHDPGIFMCQELESSPGGQTVLVFYDSGCGSACLSTRAAGLIKTKDIRPGPTTLNVAGGKAIQLPYGDVQFHLQLAASEKKATVTAIQMDDVTTRFPVWELNQAYQDICRAYGGTVKMPTVPEKVGGMPVDLLLGSKYNYLFPTVVTTLPSGLSLLESKFEGVGGHRGVLGGPHEAWRMVAHAANFMGAAAYLTCKLRAYQSQREAIRTGLNWTVETEVKTVPNSDSVMEPAEVQESVNHAKAAEKQFFEAEEIGTEAPYRCVNCRGCPTCKKGEQLEHQSLKEEREDEIINLSVRFEPDKKRIVGQLPFICDPDVELGQNRHIALAILNSRMRQLQGKPDRKQEVIKSHNKLADNGYSCRLADLPPDVIEDMESHQIDYFLPWRTVFKEGSISTPVRCVFDASSNSTSGKSLNNCLAKGSNRLEKILNHCEGGQACLNQRILNEKNLR